MDERMKGGDENAVPSWKASVRPSSFRSSSSRDASSSPGRSRPSAYRFQDVMMKCRYPYVGDRGAFPCGQCTPCRINRRRIWAHRILLEAASNDENCFVTLTYADAPRSLSPADLQAWLKRLRSRVAPKRVRFFGVGEYGDQSWRPHYHVALFGWPACNYLMPKRGDCPCNPCTVVRETWGFGHVVVGSLEPSSAQYVAGYVVKKLTCADDSRLCGRVPEFARMSLKPGIGAAAMWDVASEMMRYDAEVPLALASGRKENPLGRYLRNKLREMTGREKGATPAELEKLAQNLQMVRDFAWANDRSVSSVFSELNEGFEKKVEGKIASQRRKL